MVKVERRKFNLPERKSVKVCLTEGLINKSGLMHPQKTARAVVWVFWVPYLPVIVFVDFNWWNSFRLEYLEDGHLYLSPIVGHNWMQIQKNPVLAVGNSWKICLVNSMLLVWNYWHTMEDSILYKLRYTWRRIRPRPELCNAWERRMLWNYSQLLL